MRQSLFQEIDSFAIPGPICVPLTEREQGMRDLAVLRLKELLVKYAAAEV
jgi:hypothetical protein